MYIALKWLLSLSLLLWFSLCISDIFQDKHKGINITDINSYTTIPVRSNNTSSLPKFHKEVIMVESKGSFHSLYFIFLVTASFISLFRNKNWIKLKFKHFYTYLREYVCPLEFSSYIFNKCLNHAKGSKILFIKIWTKFKGPLNLNSIVNTALLLRIKHLLEVRKRLRKLLFITIRENRNIKMKYHLEALAKNRFEAYVNDSQKQIKLNRSQSLSYQQLYIISHQENIFLKSCLEKLTKEKKKVEQDLLCIVSKVYLSKNNDLKAYCSQFVVQTKENFLKSDVKADVLMVLKKYQSTSDINTKLSLVSKSDCNSSQFGDANGDRSILKIKSRPQSQSFRGEYVLAVKDKNGMIEKVYEYNTDYNSGDAVRRLREYSVYHVKDSFLDYQRTLTGTNVTNGFLTGSCVFQRFLQNYLNVTMHQKIPALLEK